MPEVKKTLVITEEAQEGLLGGKVGEGAELEGGQTGFLQISEDGEPTGPVFKVRPPDPNILVAPVLAQNPRRNDALTTPSGAPITNKMNPDHSFADAGLIARNPPPERALDADGNPLPVNLGELSH